ncbi:uncharacterized protein BO97DRAFT_100622 [Aspergillus homomorphus CBS 101889]|uniref:Uncharacterized protein n=1 Tax=Aspergillus homomorphus (strain CBS 101889) TaxID=1450537 RepID=A0A395HUV6_ASPHC|nr:hypothetical protein BO97DRAFT_100622 [Aspergillus homomorphus CBS 101889]RAL11309.1 hypothetical protein BO97DRAFT_100622 [Aspergillus homomorphus CBS 101889]
MLSIRSQVFLTLRTKLRNSGGFTSFALQSVPKESIRLCSLIVCLSIWMYVCTGGNMIPDLSVMAASRHSFSPFPFFFPSKTTVVHPHQSLSPSLSLSLQRQPVPNFHPPQHPRSVGGLLGGVISVLTSQCLPAIALPDSGQEHLRSLAPAALLSSWPLILMLQPVLPSFLTCLETHVKCQDKLV